MSEFAGCERQNNQHALKMSAFIMVEVGHYTEEDGSLPYTYIVTMLVESKVAVESLKEQEDGNRN